MSARALRATGQLYHYCDPTTPPMRPACGAGGWQLVPGQGRASVSSWPPDVTCGRCRRSRAWRAAFVEGWLVSQPDT